jgi:V/A-type H+-transporting ATPase subunit A
MMKTLSGDVGSITVIGAVSPQGGDFSEPVTQNTKRFSAASGLWTAPWPTPATSHQSTGQTPIPNTSTTWCPWYEENFGRGFTEMRRRVLNILNEETSLMEIVKLIGADILPDNQKLILKVARVIRQGFLQQNAFHKHDTYMKPEHQMSMLEVILHLYDSAKQLIDRNIPVSRLVSAGIFSSLYKMKYDLGEGATKEQFTNMVDSTVKAILEEYQD